eukprot:CAMPEP_0172309944 /NCGR_PEP_ID=MMETSP1058-20130122/10976_1 /TAXON_ID=83371 /ORGANISM="Detonula confervacea, Strain CCMP 353" /LENGTH=57 /DNA_ID=CAMNT_0013022667 /DNA_START=129 /DNA_END=302 /DNA_ORIENTATION=-
MGACLSKGDVEDMDPMDVSHHRTHNMDLSGLEKAAKTKGGDAKKSAMQAVSSTPIRA